MVGRSALALLIILVAFTSNKFPAAQTATVPGLRDHADDDSRQQVLAYVCAENQKDIDRH
jgi:hypothetical protein